MNKQRNNVIGLIVFVMLLLPSSSWALLYSFTDTTGIVGIEYQLDTDAGIITANTSMAEVPYDWASAYIGALLFKVTPQKLESIDMREGGYFYNGWTAVLSDEKLDVAGFGDSAVPQDSFAMIYFDGIKVENGVYTGINSGAVVPGMQYSWYFEIDPGLQEYLDVASLQVLYYGMRDGTLATKRMSESSVPVPEPATLVLLGTGMIGLAGFNKARSRKS